MDKQEARQMVVVEWAEIFCYGFNALGFIKDEHARVRAVNGMMVMMDKVFPFQPSRDGGPKPEFKKAPELTKPDALGQTQTDSKIDPAYDPDKKRWSYCPDCKTTEIDHTPFDHTKKDYQACFKCKQYLNFDGQKKKMPARGR